MSYIGNQPAESYSAFQKQDFTTSATTSYTLDHPVANQNELALFINFVRQEPTAAYTASGTSLTLTSATSVGDDMYCVYLGKAVQTVNPPNGSVGSSQVAASIITGQTALASEPADTDEFLVSDAGTLKRIDYSLIKGGGITEADQWRVTANITSNADPIASNLERIDDASFSKIGTGVSVSSGVWSFPSTGLWQVSCFLTALGSTQADNHIIYVYATTNNGSAWDEIFQVCGGVNATNAQGNQNTGYLDQFVNVTDVSNVKIKFAANSVTNGYIMGNSASTLTGFKFIRLGDSQ